jgi:hypothetical protein
MTEENPDATVYQFTPPPPGPQTPPAPGPDAKRLRASRKSRATKAAAGLVLVLGAGAGSAAAMATSSGHPSGLTSSTAATRTATPGRRGRVGWRFFNGSPFLGAPGLPGAGPGGIVHGSFTVKGPNGSYETLDTQLGTVEDVSSSTITVRSADGFTQSYGVTSSTIVYADYQGIGSVSKGDEVAVLGLASGSTITAESVVDLTQVQANRRSWSPLPAPGPGPNPGGSPASLEAGAFAGPRYDPPGPGSPAA